MKKIYLLVVVALVFAVGIALADKTDIMPWKAKAVWTQEDINSYPGCDIVNQCAVVMNLERDIPASTSFKVVDKSALPYLGKITVTAYNPLRTWGELAQISRMKGAQEGVEVDHGFVQDRMDNKSIKKFSATFTLYAN